MTLLVRDCLDRGTNTWTKLGIVVVIILGYCHTEHIDRIVKAVG